MRTHADIIREAGGAQVLHDKLGFHDRIFTVRSWFQRDSVPAEFWQQLADIGVTSLEELALAAEAKKLPAIAATRQGAAA